MEFPRQKGAAGHKPLRAEKFLWSEFSQHQILRAISKQGKKVSFSKRLGSRNQPETEQFRGGTLVPRVLKNVRNSGTSVASEFPKACRQLKPFDTMEPNRAVAQASSLAPVRLGPSAAKKGSLTAVFGWAFAVALGCRRLPVGDQTFGSV